MHWVESLQVQLARLRTVKDECRVLDRHVHELTTENLVLRNELRDAEECMNAAEHKYAAIQALHSGQTRVVTWLMDPVRLTARLRAVEPTLRVERDGDRMIVYANSQLSDAQINTVNAALLEAPNRT